MILIYIYSFKVGVPTYIKHILVDIKGQIDSSTVIVGNVNTSLASVDR